ncbi:hypothetical protein tb265_06160 [Gemmatimonadetes bacterium T265]|nr:hypothetical protein tb265_06160 [Gemmatimonadetes bacterium T265]
MTARRAALRVVGGAPHATAGLPAGAPQVVRERPWLVSDALVASRLAGHPVLPVRDVTLRRNARVVAFALNLLALPDAGTGSLAAVDLPLDVDALTSRIALPAAAVEEALRALWVADVLRAGGEAGTTRFADDLLSPTPLAYAVRWGTVADHLLDRRGEGALAAIGLFRLVLDRLTHPRAPVTLPASVVQDQLGLSEDQARRGARTLVQRGLVVEQAQAGRAKRLLLADAVLVGVPAAAPVVTAPVITTPVVEALTIGTPPAETAGGAPVAAVPASSAPATAPAAGVVAQPGTLIEYAGQRIELPAQAELSVAIPGTRVAGMRLDPASGRLIVTLEPAPQG